MTEANLETFGKRLLSPCCHAPIPSKILDTYPKQYSSDGYGLYVCPKCGDIVDHLTDITTLNKPETFTIRRPLPPIPKQVAFQEVKRVFKKWLYFGVDDKSLDIVFAGYIQTLIDGDLVWFVLIAPSGGNKTEVLRANQTSLAYHLDSLTSHTLVSGKLRLVNGEQVPVGGILSQIDGKVLVIKDLTVILSKREEERNDIFGQFRTLYDGYVVYGFGNFDSPIRVDARIGLVAGSTPVIDLYTKMYTTLGERFLKIRHNPDSEKATSKAMENLGKEEQMRAELANITERFLSQFIGTELAAPTIIAEQLKEIQAMAQACAVLRTYVPLKTWRGEITEVIPPTVEVPTRLAKQLLRTAQSLAILRGRKEVNSEDIEDTRRVARDTTYPDRIKILQAMTSTVYSYSNREIADRTGIPVTSVWREMQELEYLGVVISDYDSKGWLLKDKGLWVLLPKPSSTSPVGSETDNQITVSLNTDEEGKGVKGLGSVVVNETDANTTTSHSISYTASTEGASAC